MAASTDTVVLTIDTLRALQELDRVTAEVQALSDLAGELPGVSLTLDEHAVAEHLAQHVDVSIGGR